MRQSCCWWSSLYHLYLHRVISYLFHWHGGKLIYKTTPHKAFNAALVHSIITECLSELTKCLEEENELVCFYRREGKDGDLKASKGLDISVLGCKDVSIHVAHKTFHERTHIQLCRYQNFPACTGVLPAPYEYRMANISLLLQESHLSYRLPFSTVSQQTAGVRDVSI